MGCNSIGRLHQEDCYELEARTTVRCSLRKGAVLMLLLFFSTLVLFDWNCKGLLSLDWEPTTDYKGQH